MKVYEVDVMLAEIALDEKYVAGEISSLQYRHLLRGIEWSLARGVSPVK